MSVRIDLQRYSEDKDCATPDGLKVKMIAELMPKVEGIRVQRNRLIVATYVRPNVSAGGIILTQRHTDEDRWQGKIGLVLKIGPIAFDFDEVRELTEAGLERFEAIDNLGIPQVGDWVVFRNSETWEFGLTVDAGKAASCRMISDDSIIAVVKDPSTIW